MFRSGGASTSCGGAKSNGRHRLTADELEVAEILLSLPRLIYSNARYLIDSNVRWGSKKKRSHPSSPKRKAKSPTTPLDFSGEDMSKRKAKSPTTPLDFSGEDMSKRKMREELRCEIVRLEKKQKLEILGADENHLLRAKRLKLLQLDFDLKLPELELPELELPEESSPKPSTTGDDQKQIQSFIHEEESATGIGCSTSVTSSCSISQVGPSLSHWIPDLNLPPQEEPSQPLLCLLETRLHRAQLAAVARRRRMLIMKKKRIHHYLPYTLHHRHQQQILT